MFGQAYMPGYAASKGGVVMLGRAIAWEYLKQGIRSNVVSPGLVMTPLSAAFYADPAVRAARERFVPAGRIGRPEDMAPRHAGHDLAGFVASFDRHMIEHATG